MILYQSSILSELHQNSNGLADSGAPHVYF